MARQTNSVFSNFNFFLFVLGKDQVDASFKCLQTAIKWKEEIGDEPSVELKLTYDKVKKKYMISSIKQILYFYHFKSPRIFENLDNGEALIKALYDDQSILNDNFNQQNGSKLDNYYVSIVFEILYSM